jgi:hypothetical protein
MQTAGFSGLTAILDFLRHNHRSNIGQEFRSESENQKKFSCASEATNTTVEGITMEKRLLQKALDSMHFNREFDSNEMDRSDLQREKPDEPTI